ncbi:hypothetical protein APR11_003477 [Nocardia amikacinitolerans]|nr:hypothetical protein [Nocardia amikacinitolerans]
MYPIKGTNVAINPVCIATCAAAACLPTRVVSEYQYYEFLALDRPLDDDQAAVHSPLSTRARITATRFVNQYHWGDFKGDPGRLMECYYDAHLYVANWGTHRLILRLPRDLLDPGIVEDYRIDYAVDAQITNESVILEFSSQDEAREFDYDPATRPGQYAPCESRCFRSSGPPPDGSTTARTGTDRIAPSAAAASSLAADTL